MGQKNTKSGESKGKSSSTSRKGGTDGRTRRKHSPGSVDEEDNGGSGGTGPKYTSEEISEMERKFNEQMKKEVIDTEKSKMSKYGRRFSIALKQPPYQEQPAPEYQAQSPSQPSFLAATSTAFSAIDGANTGGCDDDGTGTGTGTSPKREKSRRLKRSERKKANRASMPPSTAALLELRFGEEARKELEIEQKMHQRHHQHHHSGSGSGSGMGSGSGSGIQRKSASPARFGTSPPHSGSSSLSPMEPSQVAFQSSSSISPQSSSSPYIGNNIYINNSTNSTNNNNNNNSNNNNNTSINNNNNSSNSSNNINDNSNNSINEKRSWGRRRSHTVIKKPEKQEKADKSEKPEKPEKPEKSSKKKLQWHRSSILITTSEISNYNSSLSGAGGGGGGSSFTPSSLSSSSNSPAVGLQPSHPQVSQLNLAQVQQQNQLQNSGNSGGSSGSAAAAANGGNETPGKRRWLRFGRRNSRVVSTEFSREYLQNTLDSYAQQPPSSSPRPSLTNSPATYTISQPQSSRQRSKGGDLGAGVSPPTADRLSGLSSSGSKSRGYSEMPPSALSQQEFKPDGQVESPRFKKADSPTLKPSATATSSSSSSSSSLMNRATRKRSNSTILAKYHKKGSQHALAIPSDQQRQHSQSQEPKTIMSLPHKSYLSSSLQQIQADKQSQSQTQLQPQSQSQQSYHHHYDQSLEGGSGSGSNGSGGGSGAGGSGSSNDTATHHRQRSKTISSLRHSMHLQKHQKQPSPSDHTSSPQASSSPLSHLHEQPQTQPQQQQSQIQSQQHQYQHLHQQQQQEEEEELSSSQQSQSSSRHSYHQHQQAPKPELPSMLIQQRSPLMESCGDTSTDIQSAEKDDDDDGAIVSPSPPTPQLQQSPTQKPKYQLQLQQLQLQQLQLQQQQQHTLHAKTPSTSSSSSSATTASIPPVPSPIAATPSQLSALSPGTVTLNVPSLPSPPSPRKMTPETTMLPTPTTQNAVSPPFQSSSATSAFLKKPKTKPKLKKLEVSPTTTLFPTANERGITPPSPSSPLSPSSASSALSSSSAYVAQIPLQQPPPLVLPRFRVPKVPQAPVRAGSQAGSISPSPVTQSPPSSGGLSKLPYYRHKSNLSKMSIASTRSSSASTMVSDYESSAAESDTCSTASSYLGSTVASSSSSSSSSSTSSSSSSSSSSTISGIGADGSVVSRSGYGEESDAMSFESVSTTSSFVPAQIVKKEQEKKSKRSHRCANNGTYRATLFSDTQPYKVAKSLNPQSNNLSLVQVRYEKEGDSAASSLWTFAVDPECTGYDLCLSVLQTDPATQTMAMMRARKGMDVRALASLGVRLYKVDESDISQSQLQSHSHQSKSQRNSKSDKPKEGESNAVVIINNTNNDDDDDNNDDDDDDDDNNDDEFDPSAPNVTQVPPGDRIAAHTSSWKSGRDGYFVVYDTSKVFTPTSPTNTVRGDSITLGGPTSSSSSNATSNSKKASPAILVDMRTGSSSGEQTSEAWIPEEDIFWVSRISSGSFSRVYKGIYKGKYVAIKILKGGLCVRNIDEFRKEFRVMKSVRHQNLLECYGASFEHNKLSYVIEYCQRGTLLHVMTDPSLKIGWDHAADFFAQALRGLQFLHEHDPPIVHRDLKSQNLLVTRSYEIKIGDFGLSRFNTASNNPTLSNMCGTMTHCAPEIFSGDLFTPKADIYSMGMILWELCTRVATGSYAPPYSEYPNIVLDIQIIAQAATKHLRPTIPASVPKKFADLIARCWDKDPEVRPDTAELLRIVEEFPQKRMSLFSRPNRKFSSLNANKKRSVRNPNSDTLASNSSTSSSQNSHSSAFPPVTPPPPLPPPVNPGGSNGNTPVSTSTGPSNTSYSTSSSFPMSTPSPQLPSHL